MTSTESRAPGLDVSLVNQLNFNADVKRSFLGMMTMMRMTMLTMMMMMMIIMMMLLLVLLLLLLLMMMMMAMNVYLKN